MPTEKEEREGDVEERRWVSFLSLIFLGKRNAPLPRESLPKNMYLFPHLSIMYNVYRSYRTDDLFSSRLQVGR